MDSLLSEPPGKLKNTGVGSLPSPGDFPDPGIELASPALQVDSLPLSYLGKIPLMNILIHFRKNFGNVVSKTIIEVSIFFKNFFINTNINTIQCLLG